MKTKQSQSIVPTSTTLEIVPAVAVTPAISQTDLDRLKNTLLKNVAASSSRVYEQAARQFLTWLSVNNLDIQTCTYETLSEYRAYLADNNAKATAGRKLVVARRLLDVAVILHLRLDNPLKQVKGFSGAATETTHRALTTVEANQLLQAIPQSTLRGKRDYALILLLIRSGMRRAEAAALTCGDIRTEQGYPIALIRHGKGDKMRKAKLHPDVMTAINSYLVAANRHKLYDNDAPLFVPIRKSGKAAATGITGVDIERIVKGYATICHLDGLTPHGLRASFVTLALEGGATLHNVQYAAGHADPRTTERYQKRKLNLADNAVDYLKL